MAAIDTQAGRIQRGAAINRVLTITLGLNLAVAFGKIGIGALTGALAISADGVHSLIDGASNVIALIAARIAVKPPDAEHPYGHRRFETIAALGIGVLLVLAAWEIGGQAVERLSSAFTSGETADPDLSPLAFAVMLITLIINIGVNRYEKREGTRLKSEVLLADAAHTGSDILVTLSVLVSMALTVAGLGFADALAALVVVALILRAAWGVLSGAGHVLVDRAPIEPHIITAEAEQVSGVERVLRARSRGSADAIQVDVDVEVAPAMTTAQSAVIADAIRTRLENEMDGIAEVEVHFAPRDLPTDDDAALVARSRADALGLSAHEVRLFEDENGKNIELHVEVPPQQTLASAHEQVTRLEREIAAQLPGVERVVTHIEPALNRTPANGSINNASALVEKALDILRTADPEADWHDPRLSALDGGCALTIHAALPADLSVEAAHDRAEAAEILLRTRLPQLQRVTIHTEPLEAARDE